MAEPKKFREEQRGRGAVTNAEGRFESLARVTEDDGWDSLDVLPGALNTTLSVDTAKHVITYNDSPDVSFDRSVNPYRGCEHGCVYCFARPSHGYLGLSAGQDFESKLFYKPDAPEILRKELAHPRYQCQSIALGINTDAYQPVERKTKLTRRLLAIFAETKHPVSFVTKSALIERDLDLLREMASQNLIQVFLSITTLDKALARTLEPRAAQPHRRLQTVETLAKAGIPVGVLIAPLIPVLTDPELERIMQSARDAGAREAGYVLLRLPHEVKDLFREWLAAHAPGSAEHVMNRVREMRGGKDYQAEFGTRMRGTGVYAKFINDRFHLAHARLNFPRMPKVRTDLFEAPTLPGAQLPLF